MNIENIFYRGKQFYWAMMARVTAHDQVWVQSILSAAEYPLFDSMHRIDQAHSIRVAQNMERGQDFMRQTLSDKTLLLKLALLHDCGRYKHQGLIWWKVAKVLFAHTRFALADGHEARSVASLRAIGDKELAEILVNPENKLHQILVSVDNRS